ncbi:unnamed protein product [Thlaspi arvense]|uniref:Uncharacterized protein n=1 Tax=Thlaspi arvense TaxID=13288 RepID=A0AAU9SP43_THLAR|nr:unnamed protein product [Thlaspi arvense]
MLGHRISRFGSAIVKQLAREGYLSAYGTRNLQRSYGQYLRSPPMVQRQARTYQEALFLNNNKFCTSSTTSSEKGDEETEKITVIFVDKDGEEIPIKVPIGMSVLEAAHENDIDLEGTDFSSILLFKIDPFDRIAKSRIAFT